MFPAWALRVRIAIRRSAYNPIAPRISFAFPSARVWFAADRVLRASLSLLLPIRFSAGFVSIGQRAEKSIRYMVKLQYEGEQGLGVIRRNSHLARGDRLSSAELRHDVPQTCPCFIHYARCFPNGFCLPTGQCHCRVFAFQFRLFLYSERLGFPW